MESGRQADCQTHLAMCEECRVRLAEFELLQRTLRLVARAESYQEASPAVEHRLLAALRHEQEAAAARQHRTWRSASPLWLTAALLLLALTFWGWRQRQIETRSTPDLAIASPLPTRPPLTNPTTAPTSAPTAAAVELPRRDRRSGSRRSDDARPAPVHASWERRGLKGGVAPAEAEVEAEEALTDYLLFNPGQRYYPLERGQLIRVMVPRSTLGSFGFPVNPERAMMPVKADLVVGEDGMARAIRFIK